MTNLVDANVLSEATSPAPDSKAIEWLRRNERELVVDPIILGEIRFGICLLPAGRQRRRLQTWFDAGVARIACVSWDAQAGIRWAELLARLRRSGQALARVLEDGENALPGIMRELLERLGKNLKDWDRQTDGISKRGDVYPRTLLFHGARGVIAQFERKANPPDSWLKRLLARRSLRRVAGGCNRTRLHVQSSAARAQC